MHSPVDSIAGAPLLALDRINTFYGAIQALFGRDTSEERQVAA